MAVTFEAIAANLQAAHRMSFDILNPATGKQAQLVNELRGLFHAGIEDLKGAGADISKNENLVKQALIFYSKANFGLEIDEKWQLQYEKTRNALASRISEIEEG